MNLNLLLITIGYYYFYKSIYLTKIYVLFLVLVLIMRSITLLTVDPIDEIENKEGCNLLSDRKHHCFNELQ